MVTISISLYSGHADEASRGRRVLDDQLREWLDSSRPRDKYSNPSSLCLSVCLSLVANLEVLNKGKDQRNPNQ